MHSALFRKQLTQSRPLLTIGARRTFCFLAAVARRNYQDVSSSKETSYQEAFLISGFTSVIENFKEKLRRTICFAEKSMKPSTLKQLLSLATAN